MTEIPLTKCQCDLSVLHTEIDNFQDIFRHVIPSSGDIPDLDGIDIYGRTVPLNGIAGGDHIIFVDFNRRYDLDQRIAAAEAEGRAEVAARLALNKQRAGLLIADVAGHRITDALLTAMLHQSFLLGAQYELMQHGEITVDLFENINTRFYHSSSQFKFITMIYGEIFENGKFRFISAGHPRPVVFSSHFNRIMQIDNGNFVSFPPIGIMPSRGSWEAETYRKPARFKKEYALNELSLMGRGDILLLYSDGLSEHQDENNRFFFPLMLERILAENKARPAREIYEVLVQDIQAFARPGDDLSLIIIKRM